MNNNQELLDAVICNLEVRPEVKVVPEDSASPDDVPVNELMALIQEGIKKQMRRQPVITKETGPDGKFACLRVRLVEEENAQRRAA